MHKKFVCEGNEKMNRLSGPWWINNDAIDPDKEEKPQEAFFRVEFEADKETVLKIAAQNFYQFWLDGAWMGYGPARASHGRLTVDAWRLPLGAVKGPVGAAPAPTSVRSRRCHRSGCHCLAR